MSDDHKKPAAPAPAADGAAPAEGKSKKKLIIFIVLGVLVLGGGGAGLYFSGILGGGKDKASASKKAEAGKGEKGADGKDGEKVQLDEHGNPIKPKPLFVDMPDLIVNLSSPSPRPHFVNLRLTLQISGEPNVKVVQDQMPLVIDSFNTYLREVRREDLQGSAGLYRLEKELQMRLDKIFGEGVVTDILFKEIIVQ